jgi:hypothetical protein
VGKQLKELFADVSCIQVSSSRLLHTGRMSMCVDVEAEI